MPAETALRDRYVALIKRAVTNYLYLGGEKTVEGYDPITYYDNAKAEWRIPRKSRPQTVLDARQLDLLERMVATLEREGVAGDLIEAGIWRGGTIIFLRALLEADGIAARRVFAADSFAGIPPNTHFRHDEVDRWRDRWVASRAEVEGALRRYDLLDERVVFVPGWFSESLPALSGERFALIRIDADSYDSTYSCLDHLYPRLAPGGFVVIDDWHLIGCRFAVNDYRARHGVTEEVSAEHGNGWWRKRRD